MPRSRGYPQETLLECALTELGRLSPSLSARLCSYFPFGRSCTLTTLENGSGLWWKPKRLLDWLAGGQLVLKQCVVLQWSELSLSLRCLSPSSPTPHLILILFLLCLSSDLLCWNADRHSRGIHHPDYWRGGEFLRGLWLQV